MQDFKKLETEFFLDSDPGDKHLEALIEMVQSSFTADGLPTKEDIRDHLLGKDLTLVMTLDNREPVSFGSVLRENDLIIQHGAAVDKNYRGEKLANIPVDLATLLEAEEDEFMVGGRHQSTYYPEYLEKRAEYYPQPGEPFPDKFEEYLKTLWKFYSPDAELEDQVMKESHTPLYADKHLRRYEKSLSKYVDVELDLFQGDAILTVGETSIWRLLKALGEDLDDSSYFPEISLVDRELRHTKTGPDEILALFGGEEPEYSRKSGDYEEDMERLISMLDSR